VDDTATITSNTSAVRSHESPRHGRPPCAPLARMMEHQPRTPSAWMILLARFTPREHASASMTAPDLVPVSSPVLRVGHFSRTLLVYFCKAPKDATGELHTKTSLLSRNRGLRNDCGKRGR
jgi:hypothetical protein